MDRKINLPDDWEPSAELLAYAERKAPHVNVEIEAEKFVNHFAFINPVKRTERGWTASFRNWLLNARPSRQAPKSFMDGQREGNAERVRKAMDRRNGYDDSARHEGRSHLRIVGGSTTNN